MKSARRSLVMLLSGATLTALAVTYIFLRVDWGQFADMKLSIDWLLLGAGVIILIGIYLTSSLRWMLLFQGQITFPAACLVVFMGHGLNAILPARGGDVVKLIYMQKTWGVPLGRAAIRLLLEKTMDLAFVALAALVAWSILMNDQVAQLAVPIGAALALILLLVVVARFPETLSPLLNRVLARLPRAAGIFRWQESELHEFSGLLRSGNTTLAILLTLAIWFALEFVFVILITGSTHIHLNYAEALFVIACGALSVGLPSAPSGIGVYHAAVMGAFELLGYSAEQGLVAATLLHLANTIPVLVLGGSLYLFSRRSGAPLANLSTSTALSGMPQEPSEIPPRRQ